LGSPARPKGTSEPNSATSFGLKVEGMSGVQTGPGTTPLTRIAFEETAWAKDRVKPTIAISGGRVKIVGCSLVDFIRFGPLGTVPSIRYIVFVKTRLKNPVEGRIKRKELVLDIVTEQRAKILGTIVQVLLPSIKMKSRTDKGTVFEKEFHDFLISNFGGYTVASGNITGYWMRSLRQEECNEHREYQIAISGTADFEKLTEYLARLAAQIKEQTVFCTMGGTAFLIRKKSKTR